MSAVEGIRLLALDVDGVLTDNAIFVGAVDGRRVEFKRFDIQDGLGCALLRHAGIGMAWVSGRVSDATVLRAEELGVTDLIQVADARKVPPFEALLTRLGLGWEAVAFLGDDLADIPMLTRVGLPMAVANAVPEVRALAAYVTPRPGGHGAVRDAVEWLLRAQGTYDSALEAYLRTRDAA